MDIVLVKEDRFPGKTLWEEETRQGQHQRLNWLQARLIAILVCYTHKMIMPK